MITWKNGKKLLTPPLSARDLQELKVGDTVYLSGELTTCRDVAHRRLVEEHRPLPVDLRNGAIIHAGPIVRPLAQGGFEMVSIGPTTSSRMERFEKEFVEQTGVRLLIGKGGMGGQTEEACRECGCIHCVFPAGNAVLAATEVKQILQAQWTDLGMPETLWTCRVEDFGPLIVSIDVRGRNLFEERKKVYEKRKELALSEMEQQLRFIR